MRFKRPISLIGLLLLIISNSIGLKAEDHIIIPGDIDSVSAYVELSRSIQDDEFVHFLNESLIRSETLDEKLSKGGIRARLLFLLNWLNEMKGQLRGRKKSKGFSINLKTNRQRKWANEILRAAGYKLLKSSEPKGRLLKSNSPMYYAAENNLGNIKYKIVAVELCGSEEIKIAIKESRVSIPWDIKFISRITKINLNPDNFLHHLLVNKKLSLLLYIFSKLSDNEIHYLGSLETANLYQGWRRIYKNKKLLTGIYILSHGLRVLNNELLMPGGTEAKELWSILADASCNKTPFKFIRNLALKDNGKLNLFYVFAHFLSADMKKEIFDPRNRSVLRKVYKDFQLPLRQGINRGSLPALQYDNIYALLSSLPIIKSGSGSQSLSPCLDLWSRLIAVNGNYEKFKQSATTDISQPTPGRIINFLSELSNESNDQAYRKKITIFKAINSKFQHRMELLTPEILWLFYIKFSEYNVLIDFIEKIPLTKPRTIQLMFTQIENLMTRTSKQNRPLFNAIVQSLLEIMAFNSRYNNRLEDYDNAVACLMDLPQQRALFFDHIIKFLIHELHYDPRANNLIDIALNGLNNRSITLKGKAYDLNCKTALKKQIQEIMVSQNTCTLKRLLRIDELLNMTLLKQYRYVREDLIRELDEQMNLLPFPEISDNAPKAILNRVMPYSARDFDADLERFISLLRSNAPPAQLGSLIVRIKGKYLIYHLKDQLLALAYAINAKDSYLRIFLNPNLIRIHQFESLNGLTPWNKSCKFERSSSFPGLHMKGGISRLGIHLASPTIRWFIGKTGVRDFYQIQALTVNIMDWYPYSGIWEPQEAMFLIVKTGRELLDMIRRDQFHREEVIEALQGLTTGYNYRKAMQYIKGQSRSPDLYHNEFYKLGLYYANREDILNKVPSGRRLLDRIKKSPLYMPRNMGSVFSKFYGNLLPHVMDNFPQGLTELFGPGWIRGEMINEFKLRLILQLYEMNISPALSGFIMYNYLQDKLKTKLVQNHGRDYHSTYQNLSISPEFIHKSIRQMKDEGILTRTLEN